MSNTRSGRADAGAGDANRSELTIFDPRTRLVAAVGAFAAALCAGPSSRAVASLSLAMGTGNLGALSVSLVVAFGGLIPLLALICARRRDARALRDVLEEIRRGELPARTWYLWTAAVLGALFTAATAEILPLLGLTLFAVAVVAGRSIAALLVDHVGLAFGAPRRVTTARVLSVVVIVGALAVPVFTGTAAAQVPIAAAVIAAVMGGSLAVQGAAGSHLRERSSPIVAAVIIYVVTIVLLAAVVAPWASLSSSTLQLPDTIWPYMGGPLGLVSLVVPIALIRFIGVLVVTTATVSGQIVSSLVVDAEWPVEGHPLHWTGLLAAGLTIVAVCLSAGGARSSAEADPA